MTDRHDLIGPTLHSEGRSSLRTRWYSQGGIGAVVVIMLIVLFVLGYVGRGRRA